MKEKNGIVIRSTGSWYAVRDSEGRTYPCTLKGKFRIKGIKTTNPVAVGDRVDFLYGDGEESGVITHIRPRDNYIIRKATKLSKVSHIIAANIDQAILVATLASPRTSTGFIDRFLVTAEAYHIPAMIVFNKLDLCTGKEKERLNELMDIYETATYPCLATSAVTGEGINELKAAMKNKDSLLAGHSGVGKSSLVNYIEPGLNLRIKEISAYHRKGQHATTFAEMHFLSFGGSIIDTPGIKEFGLINFDRTEVAERFPEMRRYMEDCRYRNCTHTHEPGCAVKEALADGKISESRYRNYLSIFNDEAWQEKDYDLL